MFVFNIKINKSLVFKLLLIVFAILALVFFVLSFKRVFNFANNSFKVNDDLSHSNLTEIMPENYTNILKAVHENVDSYEGKEIKFTGYVYRVLDFNENQFVLARDMLVGSQSYVVGFLCESNMIKNYENGTWVEIIGEITKGKYHNQQIPIVKIKAINSVNCPENRTVPAPKDTYIPTSSML